MANNLQCSKKVYISAVNTQTFRLGMVFITATVIAVFAITAQIGFAQSSGGGYSEPYLLRPATARAASLGGAYTAIVNEPDALFYNPAGLGFFGSEPMISSSVASLGLGRTHATMAWGQLITENVGFGIGMNSFVSGAFAARDIKGNQIGSYQDFQFSLAAAASYRIEFASIGAALKMLKHNLIGSKISSTGFGLDIGTKFNVLDMFSAGIAVQNISGYSFWNTKSEPMDALPYTVRAGVAMEFAISEGIPSKDPITGDDILLPSSRFVLVGLDAVLNQHEATPSLVLGAEAVAHEIIAFRAGLSIYGDKLGVPQLFPMTYWGGGVSIRPEGNTPVKTMFPFKLHIDYTITGDQINASGITHYLSLVFLF